MSFRSSSSPTTLRKEKALIRIVRGTSRSQSRLNKEVAPAQLPGQARRVLPHVLFQHLDECFEFSCRLEALPAFLKGVRDHPSESDDYHTSRLCVRKVGRECSSTLQNAEFAPDGHASFLALTKTMGGEVQNENFSPLRDEYRLR